MNGKSKYLQELKTHLPLVKDPTVIILRGHLLIEDLLDQLIAAKFEYASPIQDARLTFFQKLCIAQGIKPLGGAGDIWKPIEAINRLRNIISHDLPDETLSKKIDLVLKIFFPSDFHEIPSDIYSKSKALRQGIIFHCAMLCGLMEGIEMAKEHMPNFCDGSTRPSVFLNFRQTQIKYLPYDPGPLPTKSSPKPGDVIEFEVSGYPPYKDETFSIRNFKHKYYSRFTKLRKAGIAAMNGRAWSHLPIRMYFKLYAPKLEKKKTLLDYAAGIEDTLDGSSGDTFTYLPVIFEDDCQICGGSSRLIIGKETKYLLGFKIIDDIQQATSNP